MSYDQGVGLRVSVRVSVKVQGLRVRVKDDPRKEFIPKPSP
jgi:hypothetical protein